MKTKKVLALVVLAAFLISIVPFAAFAVYNPYSSVVKAPTESVEAESVANGTEAQDADGAEFTVVLSQPATGGLDGTETLYVASSRPTVDYLCLETSSDVWQYIPFNATTGVAAVPVSATAGAYSKTLDFKVVSTVGRTSYIVFGDHAGAVEDMAKGKDISTGGGALSNIIGQTRYPVEFTDPKADGLTIQLGSGIVFDAAGNRTDAPANVTSNPNKPANGVDTYKVQAFVTANNIPVAGKDVTFSIIKGSGVTLTATKATTDVTGKAEVKVYATKASGTTPYEIQAKTSGITTIPAHKVYVVFNTPGITSIKAESDNNQKVARDSGDFTLKFSAYDASGNRVAISATELNDMTRTVVTKPSGSGISDSGTNTIVSSFYLKTRTDGDAEIVIDTDDLKKDGDYEVKVYLTNGSTVSYKFNAKEQGDIVKMELSYGSDSYAGNSILPQPDIKYYDAEGYKVTKAYSTTNTPDVKLSISDASFIDGTYMNGAIQPDGTFRLKEDKAGVITMTAIDTTKNLVATKVLNIQKAASYLKLTPQSVGAVGGEVTVNIELVDVDGKLAASGYAALASQTNASIIAKPEGAVASADSVNVSDFKKGKASVKVSSNVEGDVTLQVIITEDIGAGVAGKVFTGACTVSFGKASAGAGQVIFIVGAPSYVSGNKVFAAESPSFIDNGRTFLGVRDMGTSIGATIEWDQASQTATLSKDGVTIKVTVGANKIAVTKSGVTSEIEIDAPAQNKNGRVYLPFRAVMEAFNYTVTFDQATNSIVCTL
ncbi:MAG: stalk domain-containing protein [Clostridiales bacterium]